ELVKKRLVPAWQRVRARIEQGAVRASLDLARPLDHHEQCLSPSDFGFHNALSDAGRVTFIDFEYAGRDDPAKLASDFCCQPEIPVPAEQHEAFVTALARRLELGES
ncbi:MAG TPA: aminoglycoside phosphotransferase family protein, partial [Hyphomicrobiaceae bacterium]|nr:aminoglycoside phosphotransferase family protein [Hyphomicrobiaceae bacterium]